MSNLFFDNNEFDEIQKQMKKSIENKVLKKYYLLGTYYMTKSSTSIKSLNKSINMFYDVINSLENKILSKKHTVSSFTNFINSETNKDGSMTLKLALTEVEELGVLQSLVINLENRVKHLSKL